MPLSPPNLRGRPADERTGKLQRDWQTQQQEMFDTVRRLENGGVVTGIDPSGRNDSSRAINAWIRQKMADAGNRGVELVFPPGEYRIESPILFPAKLTPSGPDAPPVLFRGAGPTTRFVRKADMPLNGGMFDVFGKDIIFRDFDVDGDVLVSRPTLYSEFAGSPVHPILHQNTSFWVHGGCERIRFQRIAIRHTGGYSILIHPFGALIRDIVLDDCRFENNRPHLFGNNPLDLNYGAWTGGVFVEGEGFNFGSQRVLRDFLVLNCKWRRNTGNCLWSHLSALNELHSDFRFIGNSFEDCGLDGILVGGVIGGAVEANVFRRIGYICTTDSGPGIPRWLPGVQATALDSAGLVKGVCYVNNALTSVNGGCLDLDGYGEGSLVGNMCRVPFPDEPEYEEDQIAISGPTNNGSASYGINLNNSNNVPYAAIHITITGNTFVNLPAGAIRLFAGRRCYVIGNNISAPDQPFYPPMSLGNTGPGEFQRAHDNVISKNFIRYAPPSSQPVVIEDTQGFLPFQPTDVNIVEDNYLIGNGNAVEFQPDPSSGSSA